MNPHTKLYTQHWVSLYSQAADPAWVNITLRHAILCYAAAGDFHKVNFQTLDLKRLLPFKNLFWSLSIVSLIMTKCSVYSNSHSAPSLTNSMTTSTTTVKRKGDSTDPWCILTLTSISSDNSDSTLTCISSLIQTHYWCNQNFWYSFLPHWPFQHSSVLCKKLFSFSILLILLLYYY